MGGTEGGRGRVEGRKEGQGSGRQTDRLPSLETDLASLRDRAQWPLEGEESLDASCVSSQEHLSLPGTASVCLC